MPPTQLPFLRRRDKDPAITLYWIAEPVVGRPVPLSDFNCPWCRRPLFNDVRGNLHAIVNSPVDLRDFTFAGIMQCKLCKQKWRFVVLPPEMKQG